MFKNGERLNDLGVESLKVYIANCYGLKKQTKKQTKNYLIMKD